MKHASDEHRPSWGDPKEDEDGDLADFDSLEIESDNSCDNLKGTEAG